MAEESSLRTAIDKIMGWPAGGETGGAVKPPAAPATSIALANDVAALPPDPFAAELDSLKASNAELAAQLGGGTPTTPEAPTMSQADYEAQTRAEYQAAGIPESALDLHVAGAVASEYPTYDNYYNMYAIQGIAPSSIDALATSGSGGGTPSASFQPIATPTPSSNTYNGVRYTVSKDSAGKPINPGPQSPWQFSQQYWKDLAAYEKR